LEKRLFGADVAGGQVAVRGDDHEAVRFLFLSEELVLDHAFAG
jgi:hypothetical protein